VRNTYSPTSNTVNILGAPSPQPLNIMTQTGGKAGIWQSGTGIATDPVNNRVFVVTG
jgi:iron transport multicopper oxidase